MWWVYTRANTKRNSSSFFTIIADEATDLSNTEQLSIVVWFVDTNDVIREEFLQFVSYESVVTGEALIISSTILDTMKLKWQLDLQKLCGQAYDGAGAMCGNSRGVAARIMEQYPRALYTHCSSRL